MTIMITGGTGYLGSNIARYFIEEKDVQHLVHFDRYPAPERVTGLEERVTIVQGDILELGDLIETMQREDVDKVVHLAGLPGGPTPGRSMAYLRTQTMGTLTVFEAARLRGIRRVVNASSAAVSMATERPMREDESTTPKSVYGACKHWGEQVAKHYNESYGMEIISLRPCATYGVGELVRGSAKSGLVPERKLANHFSAAPVLAAEGYSVTMPPDDQLTSLMYVLDAPEAWWLALQIKDPVHHVFNVANEACRAGDITRILRRLLPDAQIDVSETPMYDGPLMDISRLVNELGFKSRYTLEESLRDCVNRAVRDSKTDRHRCSKVVRSSLEPPTGEPSR